MTAAGPGPMYEGAPCEVLVSDYGNLTDINYSTNYTIIFAKICATPQFVSLYYQGMNASGFFVIGSYGRTDAIPNLTFSLDRTGVCTNASFGPGITRCVFQAYWVGYLNNNSFSGPYLEEFPEIYNVGPLAPGSSSTGLLLWVLTGIVVVAVAILASVATVTMRRRNIIRDAMLREELDEGSEREPPTGPAPTERNGGLDDIF